MKIYTKHGDQGETSLLGGKRVPKNHIRIQAYGTIDELNAYLGLVRDQSDSEGLKNFIITIQKNLFVIGSRLAADGEKVKNGIADISEESISSIEVEIDKLQSQLPPLKNFILPGGHEKVSSIHIARSICRRVERLIVELDQIEPINDLFLQYFNRLSDYLFVLARFVGKELGTAEEIWENN